MKYKNIAKLFESKPKVEKKSLVEQLELRFKKEVKVESWQDNFKKFMDWK